MTLILQDARFVLCSELPKFIFVVPCFCRSNQHSASCAINYMTYRRYDGSASVIRNVTIISFLTQINCRFLIIDTTSTNLKSRENPFGKITKCYETLGNTESVLLEIYRRHLIMWRHISAPVRRALVKAGFHDKLEEDVIYVSIHDAVMAATESAPPLNELSRVRTLCGGRTR